MKCKWHKCNKIFEPDHHLQVHCCRPCMRKRTAWKVARGAALVDLLVDNNVSGLILARAKLLFEIEKDTPK